MKYKEFLEYLEGNLDTYSIFIQKAKHYQLQQNAKRQPKKRWKDEKMDRAAADMWKKAMEPLYNNLKREINSDLPSSWLSYIEKHGILESVNEGIRELDFSGDTV